MSDQHLKFWPDHAMHHLDAPATNVFYNLEVSARRHPKKASLVFYGTSVAFEEVFDDAQRIAGYLHHRCGIRKGDRVLLFMQNSPQFVIAYYGILRADAVVVPLNPMLLTHELLRCVKDAGANTIVVSQELYPCIEPLMRSGDLRHAIIAAYSDYVRCPTDLPVPDFIAEPREEISRPGATLWRDALRSELPPGPLTSGPDDLCVMPYTSGTTGEPKGCIHTHRTTMHTLVGSMQWFGLPPEMTLMAVAPFFHVTGMQGSMNGPLYNGNTVVLLQRWDRVVAAECIQRYRVASWTAVPTMIQDFFGNPDIDRYDLSSIRKLSGGGAAMPAAVARQLENRGITFCEGYGLTETMAATHINPPARPKPQCLGIPIYGVDSRVIDPNTLTEMPAGAVGEIVTYGPQMFLGYWNRLEDSARAFVEIEGKPFLRTGDLGRVDEDGYFFMVDRLKRMINASGFKIWPSEIESGMYAHPAILEVCVIAASDAHRGETVKALVVLRPEWRGRLDEESLIEWCRGLMAAYKVPRIISFVDALPKTGSGKIQWRELQTRESAASRERGARP
jgi:fatty-acyl-CoA synthase